MPIYEYRCRKCGELIEKIQKFSDPPLSTHESCGGELDLVLSPPAIQFKGSGFYITDYARKSPSSSASGGSSEGSSSGDSGSKSGDGGSKSTASDSSKASSKKD